MHFISFVLSCLMLTCSSTSLENGTIPTYKKQFDKYWYAGDAEISSYELKQDRYGEIRDGQAVLVFVTEPFSPSSNTKADHHQDSNVPVLKLNYTKNFTTGIYPYSMMTSTFFPIDKGAYSMKISSSSQEWCGHTYMEMKNTSKFEISIASYFEGETKDFSIHKNILEDDIFSIIRVNPDDLPTGKIRMIPSFFYLRLMHKETKAYEAVASLKDGPNNLKTYTVTYPLLQREIEIHFNASFPYEIDSWDDKDLQSGRTTIATRIKTIRSPYWTKNSNRDLHLRKELQLER